MVLDNLQPTIFYADNVKWIQLYVHNKTVFYTVLLYLTKWTFSDDGGGRQQNMLKYSLTLKIL